MKNWEIFTRTTGIYRILNKKTNIRYIGSSKDIGERWKKHLYLLKIKKHHCSYLQNSYNIHGFQDFSFEVVEICKQDDLAYREWVNWYCEDLVFGTFNSSPVNPFSSGVIPSEETKKKTSNTMKGRTHSKEALEKMSAAKIGKKRKPFSEEHKTKMKLAKKDRIFSEEHREKLKLAWIKRKEKKKLTEECF